MSLRPQPETTFEAWLAADRAAFDSRTEYVGGEVFAMSGGSEAHNLIVANLVGELRSRFNGKPCLVYPSDMRLHIEAANVGAYPDVMVVCGERRFRDGSRDTLTNPTLIIEVLSDSTEAYDCGDKFAYYRSLTSLTSYLLVSQKQRRAELYVRQPDGARLADTWNLTTYRSATDEIPLAAVGTTLPLAEVYDKVEPSPSGQP